MNWHPQQLNTTPPSAMAVLQSLPVEVLDRVIGFIHPEVDWDLDEKTKSDIRSLSNARLVCRQWNSLATAHLFRTIYLVHVAEENFQTWNNMLDSNSVKNAARRVIFNSAPDEDRLDGTMTDWSESEHPSLTAAISRLNEIKTVQSVELRFSGKCVGSEQTERWMFEDVEEIGHRKNALIAVFEAIREYNAQRSAANKMASLRIENLQNLPLPEFTTSELFKTVTKTLTTVELQICEECREEGPDNDVFCIERQTFEPYLLNHWLTPLSDHLTTLTLYFNDCWGVLPGYFDGDGLQFKTLKTLNLGNFVIAHHGHFDWVLTQTTLETLRLDRCYIVTHLYFSERGRSEEWNVRKHGWVEIDPTTYGFPEDRSVAYTFSGTWETVFENLRKSLVKLRHFGFHNKADNTYSSLSFRSLESKETRLSNYRYVAFDDSVMALWIKPKMSEGSINFGYNQYINPAKDYYEGDSRAFEELLSAARTR
ncbi:unnamed protein product [Clonostachys byssicola]|uniref:F-box domain-containing protein n=1 Tax=Clonostachys byssicola TaxID=160290 RepID=A0A9N9UYJ2_9HYPO|nr:unnamed protein product [Clonostachys byssicola]